MARTRGPLFSLDASGAVRDVIVYSKWKGRQYVRGWSQPYQPRTDLQVVQRAYFTQSNWGWHDLTGDQQAAWDTYAKGFEMSGWNKYCSAYIAARRGGYTPPSEPPS